MNNVLITFDGKTHEYKKGITFYEVSKDYNMSNIMGFKVNNEVYGLDEKVNTNQEIEFINTNDIIGNKIYKAGIKFLFQVALQEVYPALDVHYEHSVPRGMLGKVCGDKILNNEDISKIKNKMVEIIEAKDIITKLNILPKEAITFYDEKKEYEKADNIQNINDKVVNLYRLRNKVNYFYSLMPYNTSLLDKFELVYLGKNNIIFLFPTVKSDGVVPEYVHYDNIIDSFYEGKKWLNNLHMPYVTQLNKTVSNGKIKKFINSSELKFYLNITKVINDIVDKKDIKFVMIAGPSSSGKTTTTKRLSSCFEAIGYDAINISLDDYFLDKDITPLDENGKPDFESIKALNIERFNEDLSNLLKGEEISLPRYNFLTGKSEESKEKIKIKENSIFLIEGLHALNDELSINIENKYKYKIYLSPFIPLSVDRHNYVSTLDLRLLRRIVRDNRTRGYSVVETIDSWQDVRNGEEKYIFPYIHQAETIINTALPYELGVLKVYVEPLLLSVSVNSKYYEEARRLLGFLKQFFPIPSEYVSDESILREFIGGKYND